MSYCYNNKEFLRCICFFARIITFVDYHFSKFHYIIYFLRGDYILKDYFMLLVRLFKGENSLDELKEGTHFINGAIFIGAFSILSAFYSSYHANKNYWNGELEVGDFILDGLVGSLYEILGWGLFFGAVFLGFIVLKEKVNWKEIVSVLGLIALTNLVLGIVGILLLKIDFLSNLLNRVEGVFPFLLILILFLLRSKTFHKPLIAVIVVVAVTAVGFDIINTNPIHFGGSIDSLSGYLDDIFG